MHTIKDVTTAPKAGAASGTLPEKRLMVKGWAACKLADHQLTQGDASGTKLGQGGWQPWRSAAVLTQRGAGCGSGSKDSTWSAVRLGLRQGRGQEHNTHVGLSAWLG